MGIALTLKQYLDGQHAPYDVMVHERTATARQTARACEVRAACLAKGVLLRDGRGYLPPPRGLSLFHVALPPRLLRLLRRPGHDRRASPARTALTRVVPPATHRLPDPEANVNRAPGPGRRPRPTLARPRRGRPWSR